MLEQAEREMERARLNLKNLSPLSPSQRAGFVGDDAAAGHLRWYPAADVHDNDGTTTASSGEHGDTARGRESEGTTAPRCCGNGAGAGLWGGTDAPATSTVEEAAGFGCCTTTASPELPAFQAAAGAPARDRALPL